jgi:ABC-type dipeptide/oligopeptide/nickel transport system permease subunit
MTMQGDPELVTAAPVASIVADAGTDVPRNLVWRRFRRHKIALAGAIVLIAMVLFAALGPVVYRVDPNAIDQVHWSGYPLAPGVAGHPLGTDENGRDLLARLIAGSQISLTVAFAAVVISVVIGTVLGAVSGFYGGWIDFWIMRLTDVVLCIPLLPLLLVLTAIVSATSNKASLSFLVIVVLIGALSWPSIARLVRASFLSLREREFAEAARAIGDGDARIIAAGCGRDLARIDAVVSRVRHPAAAGVVGQHARERAVHDHDRAVGGGFSGPLHPRGVAGD